MYIFFLKRIRINWPGPFNYIRIFHMHPSCMAYKSLLLKFGLFYKYSFCFTGEKSAAPTALPRISVVTVHCYLFPSPESQLTLRFFPAFVKEKFLQKDEIRYLLQRS